MAFRFLCVVLTFVVMLSSRSCGHCTHFIVCISTDSLVIALSFCQYPLELIRQSDELVKKNPGKFITDWSHVVVLVMKDMPLANCQFVQRWVSYCHHSSMVNLDDVTNVVWIQFSQPWSFIFPLWPEWHERWLWADSIGTVHYCEQFELWPILPSGYWTCFRLHNVSLSSCLCFTRTLMSLE